LKISVVEDVRSGVGDVSWVIDLLSAVGVFSIASGPLCGVLGVEDEQATITKAASVTMIQWVDILQDPLFVINFSSVNRRCRLG
jgi:hypothetical protein